VSREEVRWQFLSPLSSLLSRRVELTKPPPMPRFIVRDFTYDEEAIAKAKRELEELVVEEREMWVRQPSVSFPLLIRFLPRPNPCRTATHSPFLMHRPTSSASRASTFPNSSSFSSTSRSSGRILSRCCDTVCRRATLLLSSRYVSGLPSPFLLVFRSALVS
jgi:hypothetical protein